MCMICFEDYMAIEAQVRKSGLTIADFCQKAEINPSTWHRWKSGSHGPTQTSWFKVKAAISELEAADE